MKLVRFYPNVLYVTKNAVGFMKPGNLQKTKMVCQKPSAEIVDVVVELASNHVFYVLLVNGEILVYDMSSSKKSCTGLTLYFFLN